MYGWAGVGRGSWNTSCAAACAQCELRNCTAIHAHSCIDYILNDTRAVSSPHTHTWMIQSGVRPIRWEHVPSPWLESWKCCTCEGRHTKCTGLRSWYTARDSLAWLTIYQEFTLTWLGHEQLGQTHCDPSTRSATASAGSVRQRVWNARSQLRHCSGAPTCRDPVMHHVGCTAHL